MTATNAPDHAGCDTQDMRLVHRVFRAVFADGPTLVSGVAEGDRARAQAVSQHLQGLVVALRRHHETEDDLLWDDLTARAPGCALHVGLMRNQHAHMATVLAVAEEQLTRWAGTAAVTDRNELHASMVEIDRLLHDHLGDEERLILPVAAQTLTQREWNRLGEFARRETKPSMLFPQLGFMLDSMTPEEGRRFLRSGMPAPARLLWRLIGQRQYRRYRAKVYGPPIANPPG